ncbi:radical SAM protein [Actinoplanes sp. LDG1-06]|uniref:Radical SAM protein n=1 Tax=Paractinoplanes ovalisporus TaxID=2810368 RepID=A0ABS2AMV2_9ACTN|nr:radical SAM protein [Actinoplanes ovalisporus]MBM2620556.1 radical SAM protein [Actinoplanes ovalisporus]
MNPEFVALRPQDTEDGDRVVIEWVMSSICNYKCSYCPDILHDGRIRWPEYDDMVDFARRATSHYTALGKDVTFLYSGGEPSRYRRFVELAAATRAMGASVAILSNGSRPEAWWAEALPHLDEALLSFHLEQADKQHFSDRVAQLSAVIPTQVNVVMIPDRFAECLAMSDDLRERHPAATVHYKPMMEHWRRMSGGYDEHATDVLWRANMGGERPVRFPRGTTLKGDMLRLSAGGDATPVTPIELILGEDNHWQGWECAIGEETLFVEFDQVLRSVCGVGEPLGSIRDRNLAFPVGPVTCTRGSCTCIAGIKASKSSPDTHRVPLPAPTVRGA